MNRKARHYPFLMRSVLLLVVLVLILACVDSSRKAVTSDPAQLLREGRLTEAGDAAQAILSGRSATPAQRRSADSVLNMIPRIRRDFSRSADEVIPALKQLIPAADSQMIAGWEATGALEMRILDGEKRYFSNALPNLFRIDEQARSMRVGEVEVDSFPLFKVNDTRAIVTGTARPIRMTLDYTITLQPDAVPEGDTIRCWMPYPAETSPRQSEIRLLSTEPSAYKLSPVTDLQRTIYFEKVARKGEATTFSTLISFVSAGSFTDLTPEMIKPYRTGDSLYIRHTADVAPHLLFTPEIQSLTASIVGSETNPLNQVRLIYGWIDSHIPWASALEYSIIPDIPAYTLTYRHGDCGMQTLLFMAMARSLGIPVHWQSGWMLHPGEVNLHDWCEVYYEGVGWVPLDMSFGLQDDADPRVAGFYRSGIDAYRMIVNQEIAQPLTPPKRFMRSEPYDFQRGELEWKGGNLYFDKWKWKMKVSYEPAEPSKR